MSDGINQTNSKPIDNYDDFRFRDAAQAIFLKYQMKDNTKHSDEINATTSVHTTSNKQEKTVQSSACIIL
jgi:hypothetical protein